MPVGALLRPQCGSGGCFPAAGVTRLRQSLVSGTCCLQLLGMGHHARGPWAGLSDELISFETLNQIYLPRPCNVPFPRCLSVGPGHLPRRVMARLCAGGDSPACDTAAGNLIFHRRVRAQEPSPRASAN